MLIRAVDEAGSRPWWTRTLAEKTTGQPCPLSLVTYLSW